MNDKSGVRLSVSDRQLFDGLKDDLREVFQRWNDVTSIHDLSWAEGYAQGRFGVGVLLNVTALGNVPPVALCWFEHIDVERDMNIPCKVMRVGHGSKDHFLHHDKGAVLVGPVDLVEDPYEAAIPSLCRFYFVEKKWRECDKPVFLQSALDRSTEVFSCVSNWEVGIAIAQLFGTVDGGNGVIQGRSQVSDDVACYQGGIKGQGFGYYHEAVEWLPRVRLYEGHPHAVSSVAGNSVLKLLDVVRGPTNL